MVVLFCFFVVFCFCFFCLLLLLLFWGVVRVPANTHIRTQMHTRAHIHTYTNNVFIFCLFLCLGLRLLVEEEYFACLQRYTRMRSHTHIHTYSRNVLIHTLVHTQTHTRTHTLKPSRWMGLINKFYFYHTGYKYFPQKES